MEKKAKKTEEKRYPFLEATGFFFWLAVTVWALGALFGLGVRIVVGP